MFIVGKRSVRIMNNLSPIHLKTELTRLLLQFSHPQEAQLLDQAEQLLFHPESGLNHW